ncbi:MAG: phosphodiester glycosidase family protein [Chloroflexota bacterium]
MQMNQDNTNATLNTALDIAGFWRRLLAFLIDGAIIALLLFTLNLTRQAFGLSLSYWSRIIAYLIIIAYSGYFNSQMGQGQTVGKRLMRIVVVSKQTAYLNMSRSLLRAVMLALIFMVNEWAIPILQNPVTTILFMIIVMGSALALFYGLVFNRTTRQGLHDLLAGSYVIHTSINSQPDQSTIMPSTPRTHLIMTILTSFAIIAMIFILSHRPRQQNYAATLAQGVHYTREVRHTPRPLMVHIVEIDLRNPDLRFLVTPGDPDNEMELPARTTSQFTDEFGVQLAINGSFFEPFLVGYFLFDYYPKMGDPLNILGQSISNGDIYSEAAPNQPVLCLDGINTQIQPLQCPSGTTQAIAGNNILVSDGVSQVANRTNRLHPRTIVAVNEARDTLFMILIDGRQKNYSEGVYLAELAEIALELGAYEALNLDGGGSTTLVINDGRRTKVLNSPMHRGIPMWERPVGNHLGVYWDTSVAGSEE